MTFERPASGEEAWALLRNNINLGDGNPMVDLGRYYENEYEIDVEGRKYRLRPHKVWVLKPHGRPGIVIGIFRTPDGKIVRRNLGRVQP